MVRQRLLVRLTCVTAAAMLLHFAGCSSKPEGQPVGKATDEQPKAAGTEKPSGERPAATVATARSEMVRPEKALLLQLKREPWQSLTAVCLTPAFYNREHAMPLIFDDGSEKREVAIPHDSAAVRTSARMPPRPRPRLPQPIGRRPTACLSSTVTSRRCGSCPARRSSRRRSWSTRTQATLQALGAKTAVVVGDAKPAVSAVVESRRQGGRLEVPVVADGGVGEEVRLRGHDQSARLPTRS